MSEYHSTGGKKSVLQLEGEKEFWNTLLYLPARGLHLTPGNTITETCRQRISTEQQQN